MNLVTLRAFVKEALAINAGTDAPADYFETRAAVLHMFPKLAGIGSSLAKPVGNLIKKPTNWKHIGEMAGHAAEVGGLGILARPTIQKMRGKEVSSKSEHAHELAGLGVLAVPSAIHFARGLRGGH